MTAPRGRNRREHRMAKRTRFGIFPKVLLTTMAAALIPLAIACYLDYTDSIARLSSQVDQQLADRSDALARAVDTWVDMNVKMLRQNAALDDLATMDARRQRRVLLSIANEYKAVGLAFTVGPDGTSVARSDQELPSGDGDRLYAQQVLEGAPLGQQLVIRRTGGPSLLILSVPITVEHTLAGVLAAGVALTDVSNTITSARFGRTGYAFLLDGAGKVIAHPRSEYALKDLSRHPGFLGASETRRKRVIFGEEPDRQVLGYARKTSEGWTVVVQQDSDEAYSAVTATIYKTLSLTALTMIFVGLLSCLLTQRLTRPLRSLTRTTDDISRGNLKAQIREASRSDEIGALARAVDRLGMSVKVAMERLGSAKAGAPPAAGGPGRQPSAEMVDQHRPTN